METTVQKTEMKIGRFTIEADGKRNNDLHIQSIPGCKLRSRILSTRPIVDNNGEEMIPKDQARALASIPPIPGMLLTVDPAKLTYKITDPLTKDERLLEQLRRRIKSSDEFHSVLSDNFQGVPDQEGELDLHRMKSLVWELWHIVANNNARLTQGTLPKNKNDIEGMRGKRLLNPGSRVPNSQPRYADDYDEWVDKLNTGGS